MKLRVTSGNSSELVGSFKRKEGRRRIHTVHRPWFGRNFAQNIVRSSALPQDMHLSSTRFPQAFAVAVFLALVMLPAAAGAQGTGALLFRILLKDGGSLVSHG